jgi:thiamine-phosphate diphosphorylase
VPEAARRIVLTVVTSGAGEDLVPLARRADRSGVDHFQIREKALTDRALSARVTAVLDAVGAGPMKVIVNARPDVAALCGAHGVHLPEEGLPVARVRHAFPFLLLGASRHSLEGARRAEEEGADFVALGPIFETPGKEGRALGLLALEQAASTLKVPVFAIGGIDAQSGPRAIEAGAGGLMAIRVFQHRLEEAVRVLRCP